MAGFRRAGHIYYICFGAVLQNQAYYAHNYIGAVLVLSTLNVTGHEKTGLMYTKYTPSYYGTYLLYSLKY